MEEQREKGRAKEGYISPFFSVESSDKSADPSLQETRNSGNPSIEDESEKDFSNSTRVPQ